VRSTRYQVRRTRNEPKRGEPTVRLYGDRGTVLRWIDQKELNHLRACSAVDDVWWHRRIRTKFLGVQLRSIALA